MRPQRCCKTRIRPNLAMVDEPAESTGPDEWWRCEHMADLVKDPVCGMDVDPQQAAATEEHEGQTFYFCSHDCHQKFVADPHTYGHPHE